VNYVEFLGDKSAMHIKAELILRVLDCTVTILFGIMYLWFFKLFGYVWVCVCVGFETCGCVYVWAFLMCGCFDNMCTCIDCVFCFVSFMYIYSYLLLV
jgi:hypothetical protein